MSASISKPRFEALKRQARRMVKSRRGLAHSQALDELARGEGFNNWSLLAAAFNDGASASEPASPESPYSITLVGYIPSRRRDGRLTEPWSVEERVAVRFPPERYLRFAGLDGNFHFRGQFGQQRGVQSRLASAKRGIAFMDKTGLKSSSAWVSLFGYGTNPGGFDHTYVWRDDSGLFVVTTEPYIGADRPGSVWGPTVAQSCAKLGWRFVVLPNGVGIHYPCAPSCPADCTGHTRMYVMAPAKRGGDPAAVARQLA